MTETLSREQVDASEGPLLLEFGNDWCPHCQAARPLVQTALLRFPQVRHLKVADGPGLPLGRSFRVKLWPTLIFLRDGKEQSRLVCPGDAADVSAALENIDH